MTWQSLTSKITAIIFDFDGTIADSFPLFVRSVEHTLTRKPFTAQEVEQLRSYTTQEALKALKVHIWQLPWYVARGMREIDRHQDEVGIFLDMPEIIAQLYQQGYKLHIVSSHSETGIKLFLTRYGLSEKFGSIYSNAGLFGKPKALKRLQKECHYSTEECVVIGDETRDIEAARKAGMRCIAVGWGFNTVATLARHSPDTLVTTPSELPEAIVDLSSNRKTS